VFLASRSEGDILKLSDVAESVDQLVKSLKPILEWTLSEVGIAKLMEYPEDAKLNIDLSCLVIVTYASKNVASVIPIEML